MGSRLRLRFRGAKEARGYHAMKSLSLVHIELWGMNSDVFWHYII